MQFITQPMPLSPEVIDDRVATVLDAGDNITLNYDDVANTLTISASDTTFTSGTMRWTTSTSGAVASGYVGLNSTDYATATEIRISETGSGGSDITPLLNSLHVNDVIYLQEQIDSTHNARYTVSGSIVDLGTYRTIPVTNLFWSGSAIGNNQVTLISVTIAGSGGGGGGTYTDEQAQDAVGGILQDSATIDYVYNDATPYITGLVKDNSITEAMLNLSDNTTKNASSSAHGLLPKLSNNATQFLDGTGAWSTPASGGSSGGTSVGSHVTRVATMSINAGATTAITFDTEVRDDSTFYTAGQPTRLTVPTTGWYSVTGYLQWDANLGGTRIVELRVNNSTYYPGAQTTNPSTDQRQSVALVLYLVAGDYVELTVYQSSGAARTLTGGMSIAAITSGAAASTFVGLIDTPDAYTGQGGKVVAVNTGATALEFIAAPSGGGLDTEAVQDAIGTILVDTSTIDFTYNDATPSIIADVKDSSITVAKLQTIPASRLLGRGTTGTGAVEVIQVSGSGLQFTGPVLTLDVALDAIATANPTANTLVYFTGTNTAALQALTAAGRALLDDADNAAQRTTLGLGTIAQQNANNVAITGGSANNLTEVGIGVADAAYALDVNGHASVTTLSVNTAGVPSGHDFQCGWGSALALRLGDHAAPAYPLDVTAQVRLAGPVGIGTAPAPGVAALAIGSGNVIVQTGNYLGIQTTPAYPLDVTGAVRVQGGIGIGLAPTGHPLWIKYTAPAAYGLVLQQSADSGPVPVIFLNAAGAGIGSITTTASTTSYNTSSDTRLKHAVQAIGNALATIQSLKPVRFKWNADDSDGEGFLAHELQQIIPAAVSGEQDALNEDGSILPQQVDYSKLVPWLVGAVQELSAQVQSLSSQLAQLKAELGAA